MKFSLSIFFSWAVATALARPDGAPTCDIDGPAPRSLHLLNRGGNQRITGSLADGGFIVQVGGTVLDPSTTLELNENTTYDVVVTSGSGATEFRGVLGIIHSATAAFTTQNLYRGTSEDLQNSTDCAEAEGGLAGVTHVDNNLKTSVTAKLNIPFRVDLVKLDVNIVVANNRDEGSIYYYTQYTLKVTGVNSAPTAPPTGTVTCGLLGRSIFCPLTFCGIFGQFLGLC